MTQRIMKSREEQLMEELKVVKLKLQSGKAKIESLHRQNKSLENKLVTSRKQSEALKVVCFELKKLIF